MLWRICKALVVRRLSSFRAGNSVAGMKLSINDIGAAGSGGWIDKLV